jgi:hypothetical protein
METVTIQHGPWCINDSTYRAPRKLWSVWNQIFGYIALTYFRACARGMPKPYGKTGGFSSQKDHERSTNNKIDNEDSSSYLNFRERLPYLASV